MATSGTVTFSVNRDTLIKDSLIDAGVIAIGQTPEADVIEFASRKLNMLLKLFQTRGLKLWKTKEFTLFLEDGTTTYSLGPSGSHVALTSGITKTEIKTAAVAAATSIDVDSTSGMAASSEIGIELDDGTFHWTTISSVTDSDTVVIASGIPTGDAAAVDNDVYFFATKLVRPLELFDLFIRDKNNQDRPVELLSRNEYYNFGKKTDEGAVVQVMYDPALTRSQVRVYPTPSNSLDRLMGTARLPIEDVTSAAHDFDMPQEWYLAVNLNLAVHLTPAAATESKEFKKLESLADKALEAAEEWDVEHNTSVQLSPRTL